MVSKKLGVRKGWESRIVVSKLGSGTNFGIEHEILNKKGDFLHDKEMLYVGFYPITDTRGVPTTDKEDIRLWADGNLLDSIWENKEQWVLYPEEGAIEMTYGGRLDGQEISIDYNYQKTIGYATGISFTADTTLETHNALGTRKPVGVTASTTTVTGSVDQYYIDRVLFEQASKLVGGRLVPFNLEVTQGPEREHPMVIKFTNVRFGTWSIDFTQDGITANSSDFTAENINVYYL
jgi:hypothetical protein